MLPEKTAFSNAPVPLRMIFKQLSETAGTSRKTILIVRPGHIAGVLPDGIPENFRTFPAASDLEMIKIDGNIRKNTGAFQKKCPNRGRK